MKTRKEIEEISCQEWRVYWAKEWLWAGVFIIGIVVIATFCFLVSRPEADGAKLFLLISLSAPVYPIALLISRALDRKMARLHEEKFA